MTYAAANEFVVLTNDLDFGSILAVTHGHKPSVVQIRAMDVSPDVIGRQVTIAPCQMAAELVEGALITIDPDRACFNFKGNHEPHGRSGKRMHWSKPANGLNEALQAPPV